MLQCPICKKSDLPDKSIHCPQCNADLECFHWLDELTEPTSGSDSETILNEKSIPYSIGKGLLFVLFLLLILLLILQSLYFNQQIKQSEQHLQEQLQQQLALRSVQLLTDISHIKVKNNPTFLNDFEKIQELQQTLSVIEQKLEQQIEMMRLFTINTQSLLVKQAFNKVVLTKEKLEPKNQFQNYHSHKKETLWSISKKFYGKGDFYPVILKMNPGLTSDNHSYYGAIKLFIQQDPMIELYQQIK